MVSWLPLLPIYYHDQLPVILLSIMQWNNHTRIYVHSQYSDPAHISSNTMRDAKSQYQQDAPVTFMY